MPHDPPVTEAQRAYLRAFDGWLRVPSAGRALERQEALDAVRVRVTGVRPRGRPEQHDDDESPRMNPGDTPRPTKVVLADALAELQAREAKLKRLESELAETRAAIKVLRKLVGPALAPAAPAPAREVAPLAAAPAPRRDAAEIDEAVLRVIAGRQPVATGIIVRDTGLELGVVRGSVKRMRESGRIRMVGDKASARYLLPENANESEAA